MEVILQYLQQIMQGVFTSGGDVAGSVSKVVGKLDTTALAALAAALGWAAGIRLYLVVFLTGLAGFMGFIPLPSGLSVLQHPAMLMGSGFMVFVEFFADKIPGLDSIWDVIHTVIRVPAGAALAGGVFGADSATMGTVAALLGGTLAATAHATKATTRAAVNTSPEPFSNIIVSFAEEGLVMFMLWLSTNHPVIFGIVLLIILVLSVLLIVALWKFLRMVVRKISSFFSGTPQTA
ncbi:MAG: DUF4126 domain-containing protein [Brachymonas sp.]|nr:DUF4126 domain-containing protein [Brachymonas sp.]